mgnify:CR=1 FL=1
MLNLITENLNSNLKFTHCPSDGWINQHDKSQVKNLANDAFYNRIEHTRKWCLKNRCNYSFQQTLFMGEDNSDVLSRKVELEMSPHEHEHNIFMLRIGPANSVRDVIFHSDYDLNLLNAMSDALLITEADIVDLPGPKIVFANKAFERMSGYTAREVLGKSPRILQGEDSACEAKHNIRKALENWGNVIQKITNYRKDGSKFSVELNISPVKDTTGWYTNWISVQRDISEETRNLNVYIQNEMALDATGIGTWSWDLESDEISWDDKMFSLYGINKKQKRSINYEFWVSTLHEADKQQAEQVVKEAAVNLEDWQSSFRIRRADTKQICHMKARAKVIRSPVDGRLRMLGVNWDVTKDAEHARELEKQQKIAIHKSRLASLGELAAGIGHEVNNPLSIISVLTDVLSIKLSNENISKDEIIKTLENINGATKRIEKIVKGLKSISREHDGQTMTRTLDLVSDIREALDLMTNISFKKGVTVMFEKHPTSAIVRGDHAYIQQIFVNLLNNASDAVEHLEGGEVKISIESSGNYWRLIVKDNGKGIADEIKDKIFAPFTTTKELGKGTGLGLSISKSLSEKMGGRLNYDTSNSGTRFFLDLPKFEESVVGTNESINKKYRVLIVEDDSMVLESIIQVFSLFDCDITGANNGQKAIDIINESKPFDLILTDLRMPIMDGYEFLDRIVDLELAENAKVYTLTGDASSFTKEQKKQINRISDGWIEKPLRYNIVEKLIKELEHKYHS